MFNINRKVETDKIELGTTNLIETLKKKAEDNEILVKNITGMKLVGGGNFGAVYQGLWNTTRVALKQLIDTNHIAEFAIEAELLRKCNHPNVVRFFGVYFEENKPYIVMEYMNHGDVLSLLKEQILSLKQLNSIVYQALQGMVNLEERKIIHSDLAARNLLVHCPYDDSIANFVVKIGDLGLGKKRMEQSVYETGKPVPVRWTAPEVFERGKYSSQSDVWSFGNSLPSINGGRGCHARSLQ